MLFIKFTLGDHLIFIFLCCSEFPNPTTIDPCRPKRSSNLNSVGFHICTGVEYAEQTIAEMFRVVFKLQNVRRVLGDAGRLSGFMEIANETEVNVFIKPNGTTSPWPGSMYLVVSLFFFLVKKQCFCYSDCWVPVRPVIFLRFVGSVIPWNCLFVTICHLYIM